MHGFIKNVVKEIFSLPTDISECIIILPNKRSEIFLKKEISRISNKTIFSPIIYDIDEFMSMISGIEKISDTELLFEFYGVYLSHASNKEHETFDEFISWGKTLLKDYNEIDRELCNTDSLFDYLEAFKELNHWSNYEEETELIKKYKTFWSKIKLYHKDLITRISKNSKGYQGLIYREAFDRIQSYIENKKNVKHIFIGFNALSKSESKVIQEIIATNGEIYWDIDKNYLNSEYNNASFFIKSYLKEWSFYKRNKIKIIGNEYLNTKNINLIGTPKNVGQIKFVGSILNSMNSSELNKTAIVLADERMLIPMINSIPSNVKDINVTMGYPLRNSNVYSFFNLLLKIHSKGHKTFYHRYIKSILSHELINPILIKDIDITSKIRKENLIYLTQKELIDMDKSNDFIYQLVFSQWESPIDGITSCIKLIELLKRYYSQNIKSDLIDIELLYNINKIFLQIKLVSEKYNYLKNINSLRAIFKELCEMSATPFNGEPVKGIQIMGMLETRLLNYDNIIITSMNEGILPSGNKNNSFIPFQIKKDNDLQTFKEKDAVFAYHFYRIIQRAQNIWMTYNTEPDAMNNGEVSRFITQLEVENIHKINKSILIPKTPVIKKYKESYIKSEVIIKTLNELVENGISASILSLYVLDKIKFFDSYILKINEKKIEETIASSTLGNIIHDILEDIYKPYQGKKIFEKELNEMINNVDTALEKISKRYVMKKNLIKGKNVIIIETAKKYVERIINLDREAINNGNTLKILLIEKRFNTIVEYENREYRFKGKVDRVDEYNGVVRIIDYKSGKKLYKKDVEIKNIEEIKTEKGIYNLQLMIYALGLHEEIGNKNIKSGIISLKNMKDGVLEGKCAGETQFTEDNLNLYKKEIFGLIDDILNKDILIEN